MTLHRGNIVHRWGSQKPSWLWGCLALSRGFSSNRRSSYLKILQPQDCALPHTMRAWSSCNNSRAVLTLTSLMAGSDPCCIQETATTRPERGRTVPVLYAKCVLFLPHLVECKRNLMIGWGIETGHSRESPKCCCPPDLEARLNVSWQIQSADLKDIHVSSFLKRSWWCMEWEKWCVLLFWTGIKMRGQRRSSGLLIT